MGMRFTFRTELWLYEGDAAWHFVTLPHEVADEIEGDPAAEKRGFGSVRVHVTIGSTTWSTSIFPDRKAASYVLPVKKQVRVAEGLEAGAEVELTVEVAGR